MVSLSFFDEDDFSAVKVLIREVYLFRSLFGDVHGRRYDVGIACVDSRNDSVEFKCLVFDFEAPGLLLSHLKDPYRIRRCFRLRLWCQTERK